MNFTIVKKPEEIKIPGAQVHLEREDGYLKRLAISTSGGEMFVISAGYDNLKILKAQRPEPAGRAPAADELDNLHGYGAR